MSDVTTISRTELEDALQDADFPATRDELLETAVVQSTPIERALRSLPPEVAYANLDEVVRSVHADVEHGEGAGQRQRVQAPVEPPD